MVTLLGVSDFDRREKSRASKSGTIQGRDLSSVRLIQSESENSLRNRINSDLRKNNPAGHFSFMNE
eukprot:COSAG02_NODE_8445_length_2568_cov_257.801134_3_plen_66_part_00